MSYNPNSFLTAYRKTKYIFAFSQNNPHFAISSPTTGFSSESPATPAKWNFYQWLVDDKLLQNSMFERGLKIFVRIYGELYQIALTQIRNKINIQVTVSPSFTRNFAKPNNVHSNESTPLVQKKIEISARRSLYAPNAWKTIKNQ